jgi:membrane protease YdiL (CAAX protease family)
MRSQSDNTQMKTIISEFLTWQPSQETCIAFIAGSVVIALSIAMGAVRSVLWLSISIRDIGQISLGILFPLLYIYHNGKNYTDYGFGLKRWYIFLPINFVLGALLLMQFLADVPPPADFRLDSTVLWTSAFIMLAVIFEMVFFYGFLRTLFEKSFGIIPGILLSAAFYSFHHVGFQPEFGKLFIVGVVFAAIYRIGNNVLLLYPFFAGVGATYDVLIQSTEVIPIVYPEIRTLYLGVIILGILFWVWVLNRRSLQAENSTSASG